MTVPELNILLQELCDQPHEQQWLEFKSNKGSVTNETIGEYISALSNAATLSNKPFGYMVWGVEDATHKIKGTNFTFETAKQGNQNLELWLRNLLQPKISFDIFKFEHNDKHIVMLRIPAAKREPTAFQNEAYTRIGSHKTKLRQYPDFVRMIYNSGEDWSARIVPNATIDSLDTEALKVAREKFKQKHANTPIVADIDKWDDATFLDKIKVTDNGKITNAAILLLGKDESTTYISPAIAQITWKLDTEEKAYEHFSIPFLLTTTKVAQRIRNVQHKFFPNNQLLATTVNKYDTRVLLEALHNCIAHQDYSLRSRIIVTEKVDRVIFDNSGSFFDGNPEDYTEGTHTPKNYRNPFLAHAMANLGMIDTLGYGIHTMYIEQRKRYFPLPDYLLSKPTEVVLQIYGHSIDENYSKMLIERQDLPLSTVVLLDRVQKKLSITESAAAMLRKDNLIEGRRPNYYVASTIAAATDHKATYIKNKAFDDEHYKKMIVSFIKQYGSATRKELDDLITDKLSAALTDTQKNNKVGNLIAALKRAGLVDNEGTNKVPKWVLLK